MGTPEKQMIAISRATRLMLMEHQHQLGLSRANRPFSVNEGM